MDGPTRLFSSRKANQTRLKRKIQSELVMKVVKKQRNGHSRFNSIPISTYIVEFIRCNFCTFRFSDINFQKCSKHLRTCDFRTVVWASGRLSAVFAGCFEIEKPQNLHYKHSEEVKRCLLHPSQITSLDE